MDDHRYAWILWYIWKGRNNKVLSNLDIDPSDTLKLAETESILWAEAHVPKIQRAVGQVEVQTLPSITGRWCFIDGSWKDNEPYSGQGWYSILEGFDGLMEDIKTLKDCFLSSELIHVPRTKNLRAYSLARSARKQLYFIVHMDAELPYCFTESV
ncbi:hypothetical protein Bca101_085713 [Brassica carinata]